MALSRSSFAANERTLRILTLYTSALATPLLIACTAVSFEVGARYWYMYRGVNAFCFGYIPLALTGFASALSLLRRKKTDTQLPAGQLVFLDGLAGISYLGILIGIWAVEIRMLGKSGFGLLAGYTTAPMIVNMFVHGYIVACNISTFIKWLTTPKLHQCPNCHSNFAVRHATQVQVTTQSGEGYSLLRGEDYLDVDADAEPYAGETARSSEEQVRPEAQSKSEDKKVLVV